MLYTTIGMPIPYTFECCDDLTAGIVLFLAMNIEISGRLPYKGAMRYHEGFPVLIPTPAGKSDLYGSIYLSAIRSNRINDAAIAFRDIPACDESWSKWFKGDRCDDRFCIYSSVSSRYTELSGWIYRNRRRVLKALRSFVPGTPEDREHVLSLLGVHERFKSLQESFMDARVVDAMSNFATKVYGPQGLQYLLHDKASWAIRRIVWNIATLQEEQKPRNVVPRWKKRRRAKRLKKRGALVG